MCGRYTLTSPHDAAEHFQLGTVAEFGPRYNIAPSQEALIVAATDSGVREGHAAAWGFAVRPRGDRARSRLVINARSEDVERRPLFRESFVRRRCLVPANGFYEWRSIGKTKQPYYFSLPDSDLFGFAGLWNSEPDNRLAYVILTTEADEVVGAVHDRMPVILSPENYATWLAPRGLSDASAREMLLPSAATGLVSRAVGLRVNDASYDHETCVRSIEGPVDLFTY